MAASRGIIGVRAAANLSGVLTFLTYATNAATASIYLRNADGTRSATPATVYTTEDGGSTASQPIQADANSYFPGWLPQGRYVARISATGLSSWDEPFNVGVNVEDTAVDLTVAKLGVGIASGANPFRAGATNTLEYTAAGQLQLPATGSGGGVLVGSDVQLSRSAAGVARFQPASGAMILEVYGAAGQNSVLRFGDLTNTDQWRISYFGASNQVTIRDQVGGKDLFLLATGNGPISMLTQPVVASGRAYLVALRATAAWDGGSADGAGSSSNRDRIRILHEQLAGFTNTTNGTRGDATTSAAAISTGASSFHTVRTIIPNWNSLGGIAPFQVDISLISAPAAPPNNYAECVPFVSRISDVRSRGTYAGNYESFLKVSNVSDHADAGPARAFGTLMQLQERNAYSTYNDTAVFAASDIWLNSGMRGIWMPSTGSQPVGTGIWLGGSGGFKRFIVCHDTSGNALFAVDGSNGYIGSGSGITTNQSSTIPARLTIGAGSPTTAAEGLQFGITGAATLYRSGTSALKTDGTFQVAGGLISYAGTTPISGAISPSWPVSTNPGVTTTNPAPGTIYAVSVEIPRNQTFTGIAYYAGAISPGAEKVTVVLWDNGGNVLKTSTVAGTSISTVQTAANRWVPVPFTSTYAAIGPGRYYLGVTFDTATASTFRETGNFGYQGNSANQTGYTFGNALPSLSIPSGPATVVPLMYIY